MNFIVTVNCVLLYSSPEDVDGHVRPKTTTKTIKINRLDNR